MKKISQTICRFKKKYHLCNTYHSTQARRLAILTAGIFYAHSISYSSVPCGALMRPQPVSQVVSNGERNFFCLLPLLFNILFHLNYLPK